MQAPRKTRVEEDMTNVLPQSLRTYFDSVKHGPGVWKWLHYFDVYERHLAKFVGCAVTVAEVGVYSGGSLSMWRHYFGPACQVHGIDIQEGCKVYEGDRIKVHVGDQADRAFWKRFRNDVPNLDVLIDDGGHLPLQQSITLEEILLHLRPGGVYICEDIHQLGNAFSALAHQLADQLNSFNPLPNGVFGTRATPFQAAIHSFHFYPYLLVIEKTLKAVEKFEAPKHGTEWQPFL